ncbi:hypothetical protein [Paenibacillus xylaniclasticus]|uniref:hypothetical protein n=1 Tax=Paenibacillus xylaniclasticus TaxID=588083 RepID=UPI000FD9952E|nr:MULTISPECIES: hypothetical protein [Paenibacillus]GFN34197.1 hypothetical protein PCURB6_44570 [Paenibacillus curdlanolyticus]
MEQQDELQIDQEQLASAWLSTLPTTINSSDQAEVWPDAGDPKALRVTIHTAGHQDYSFDFKVGYVDSREVKVELIDVEKAGQSVDERTDIIQQLALDYKRHLHECAQALQSITHH